MNVLLARWPQWIFWLKTSFTVLSQTGLPCAQNIWKTPHTSIMLLPGCFFYVSTLLLKVYIVLALGGILSLHQTPELLHGLGSVTRVSTDKVVCSKWGNVNFGWTIPLLAPIAHVCLGIPTPQTHWNKQYCMLHRISLLAYKGTFK